jgi:hypothetical protein
MGVVTALKFAKTFGPYIAIVGLIMAVLFLRNDNTAAHAGEKAAKVEAAGLREANAADARTIASFGQQRIDNDAIASAVAARVNVNVTHETRVVTALKDAKRNDPQVRNWADTAIPGSVLREFNAAGDRVQAPAR